ncbi:hypothetical protein CMO88_00800 [Candidatus Woesearchaeota archaeon]|nr:hypothetical protein [Candidatus Woesearchaeota archaeon]|tara:strand:- start:14577 stop:16319 length:1743 start_codon:yes stop_codon:yes gene_type:complete
MVNKFDVAAFIVLLAFAGILVGVSTQNSAVFEENNHLSTGYYFLLTNDYRLGTSHPPLTYELSAIPLLIAGKEFPFENQYCKDFLYYGCAQEFLYNSGIDSKLFIFLGRLPFIIIAMLTGLVIYMWSKELYGAKAGIISLLLYSFMPVILGWSALIMTDFSVSAFAFISVYFLWKLMRKSGIANLLLTGLFFGLAMSSKFTAILFLPIYLSIAIFWFLSRKSYDFPRLKKYLPKKLRLSEISFIISMIIILIIAFFVVWSAYGFDVGSYSSGAPQRYTDLVYENVPDNFQNTASFLIEKMPLPAPSYFVGTSAQMFISATGSKPSFFLGETHEGSVWYFHIIEFLVKVPIAFLILLAISIAMIFINKKNYKNDKLFLLLPVLIYYIAFVVIVNIGSGIQHVLPVFLFLPVFMGRLALSKQPLQYLVYALIAWYIIASLLAFPHYISYFNEAVDDDKGYEYFLGANLDLGQDLKGLSDYAKQNNLDIKLSYLGTTDPAAYLDYEYLASPFFLSWVPGFAHSEKDLEENYTESCGKTTGIIAISITNRESVFMQNKSCYDWLGSYEPIEIIGHTIFVYNITS